MEHTANYLVMSLMLVIDTCISANLTIKHKNKVKTSFAISNFKQYVATTSVPLLQTFHALQFENPGSSPEVIKQ